MFTDRDLMGVLAECYIPALRRDVVAAALVRSATVEVDADAPGSGIAGVPVRYVARVTLSAPGGEDALNALVRAAVENRLFGLPSISRAVVTMKPALFPILGGR